MPPPTNGHTDLSDVTYVKRINIGSINPNSPLNEDQQEMQMRQLNKCLSEPPKGRIIGKDITVGVYQMGEHQLIMQRITYHVGFKRKPVWIDEPAESTNINMANNLTNNGQSN